MSTSPMTEERLKEIELRSGLLSPFEFARHGYSGLSENEARELFAEVRRLRSGHDAHVCSGPMTDQQRAAIAHRARCASKGPWKLDEFADYVDGPRQVDGERIADIRGFGFLTSICGLSPEGAEVVQRANGEFIAHAREDVPALLAEIERLKTCQQESWCPGVPVACQKHVDQLVVERHGVKWDAAKLAEDLEYSKKLLTERATQAEELLALNTAYRHALEAAAQEFREFGPTVHGDVLTRMEELLHRSPERALEMERARRAVVDAAILWTHDQHGNGPALWRALKALEKLEAAS